MATDLETAAAAPPIEDDSDFAVDTGAPRFSTAFRGSFIGSSAKCGGTTTFA